jgi:hypothetical protein
LSVLTKIFIGLLIVVVLIMTSGMIVYVNRTEDFKKTTASATEDKNRAIAALHAAQQEVVAVRGERDYRVMEATARGEALRPAFEAAQAAARQSNDAVTKANADAARAQEEKNAALASAQAALGTVDAQQKVINEMSTKLSDEQKRAAAAETRIAALIRATDGQTATIRRMKEEITALEQKVDEMSKTRTVINANAADQGTNPGMAMNLQGVIKATRVINGTPYGTISIGSAQAVQKGMKFKLVDGGNFLGYLTVDSVDTEEAVGHMEGPNLNQVRKNTQVKTQW